MTRRRHGAAQALLWAAVLVCAAGILRYGGEHWCKSAYPMKYSALVDRACAEKGLDRAFVYALIRTESGFRANAVSEVGARGLMQMMPDTFDWVQMRRGEKSPGFDALFEPDISVEYGTDLLKLLFEKFESEANVLCAYHAGWGNAQKWLRDERYAPNGKEITEIPYADTAHYVDKVSRAAAIYRKLYGL